MGSSSDRESLIQWQSGCVYLPDQNCCESGGLQVANLSLTIDTVEAVRTVIDASSSEAYVSRDRLSEERRDQDVPYATGYTIPNWGAIPALSDIRKRRAN